MKRQRVLMADDHYMVAERLRSLLALDFDVVGIVADGRELVAAAQSLAPDVIVLDISMPRLNGIEAARQIHAANPRVKLIFLTMHSDAAYAVRALEAGASGFVLKHSATSELITAIRSALAGGTYVTPQIAGNLLGAVRHGTPGSGEVLDNITPRQREILQLIAEGWSAKEIAATLHISRRTAEFHKARLMDILNLLLSYIRAARSGGVNRDRLRRVPNRHQHADPGVHNLLVVSLHAARQEDAGS